METGMVPFKRWLLVLLPLISTLEIVCSQNVTDPSPVTGLSVVSRTTDSLRIEWTSPNDTRASNYTYNVTVTNVAGGVSSITTTGKNETTFTATGLQPGDQYLLSVRSVTPEDTLSTPVEVTSTTNPSPVTGLSVVNGTTESLRIKWTRPTDTRASDYTYRVTVTNVTGGVSWTESTSKDKTTFTATGLQPGDQYQLSVQSVTPEDTVSSPLEVTNTTNPSPVTGLSVVNGTTQSLTIEWTRPTDTRATNYTYIVTVTNVTGGVSSTTVTSRGETTFKATGLQPGDQYLLSVQSVTPEDTWSTPVEVTNTTNPSPVTGLTVVNGTTHSLRIEWTPPTDTRATNYTYKVTVTNVAGGVSSTTITNKGETAFTATGLQPGDQYQLSVQSVTPEDTLSTPVEVTSTTNPSPVTGLSVVNGTTQSLTIEWTSPNDTTASNYIYNVTVTNVTGGVSWTESTSKGETTFTATGLQPGDQYQLSVQSVTPEDTLSTPEQVTNTTNPSPVTGLSVVNGTTQSLGIEWTSPTDTRASNYTYIVTVTNVTGGGRSTTVTSKGETAFTATGLQPGDQYQLSVQSVTPEGTLSTPVEVTSTTNPSPVTGLSVVNGTTQSLTIEWTRPTDTRASNYTYNVTVTNVTGGVSWTQSTSKDETTFTATRLQPGDQYLLSVQSVTPEDTLSTPAQVTSTTNPSPVTGLSVVNGTTESLTIEWTSPNDTRASNYIYNVTVTNVTGGVSWTQSTSKDETTFTATRLQPGDQYQLSVQSVTPEDTLSTPVEVTSTTNPSPVTGLSVVNGTTQSLTIEWTRPTDTRASNYTYRVTVTNVTGGVSWSKSTSKGETTFTATGLQPGDQYQLSVQSVTPEDTLSTPVEVKSTTDPSPVTGLSVVNSTTQSLRIEWTTPNNIRASNYTYNVTVTNVTDGASSTTITSKGETTFTVTGLQPGDQYRLSVRSVTPEDTWSTPAQVTSTSNPSPVSGLTVVNRTTVSIEVTWAAPTDARAPEYTYRITLANVTRRGRGAIDTGPGVTTFTVTNLVPGVEYELRLQSVTPAGTRSSPETVRNATIPAAISDFRCSGSTGYMVEAKWSQPNGQFSMFKALTYDGEQLISNLSLGKEERSLTVDNLQPGRTYTLRVVTESGNTSSQQMTTNCPTSSQPIIIGATVGSLLGLILIGILVFFIIRKGRQQRKQQDPKHSLMYSLPTAFKPIPVSEYKSYYQRKHADTDIGFAEEYQGLANVGTNQSKEAFQVPDNKVKNRYTNIFPYDVARVKLDRQPNSSSSDYINASYMPGYHLDKAFIAAQGPLPNTVVDFWRMVWEQKTKVIVMLTNCVEQNRVKCERYWPMDMSSCLYGDIVVNIVSEETSPEWTTRKFNVKKTGCPEPRTITQFHFTSWPDHGVPKTTDKLLQFQRMMRDYLNKNRAGLPVVHCSAGVGRTGTLIALDYLLQRIEKEAVVDVYGIVHNMRMSRTCMVQTENQYIFLHQCILDVTGDKSIDEPIYENQADLIYENVDAIKVANNHRV
ncbi:receptor-type tyrosine-protein phosphatase H-like isoform X8 [Amblyraja radiata]|uniref:receptor-type tyrosine-protein phosphatase H-like isoform X8 n=1 Tax=Amblyraja radiata TaxID=386614 RepID=UPI0014035C38|nr:receptor-type tyrosine-protein phosphatase H-like isoform X8 [Amblyraja radiata]